jgi:dihydroxyacetone kinase-like protein
MNAELLPDFIQAIETTLNANAETVTALDSAIGDGDHLTNLQRGVAVLQSQASELAELDWPAACQKMGMSVMSKVGGASGSLYGTLLLTLGKNLDASTGISIRGLATAFAEAVEAVKLRGKSGAGEKTMLDVLIPVSEAFSDAAGRGDTLPEILARIVTVAEAGLESTRDMLATKGRASFLGERAKGHLDAGAKTSQLMICAIVGVLAGKLAADAVR